jgi:hypothetical protein
LVTASAVRKGEIPARRATAIAMGATRATLAIAPGPTVETAQAMKKSSMGIALASPRARRRARAARPSRVPLDSARANSSVTPARVTKSWAGKLFTTTS